MAAGYSALLMYPKIGKIQEPGWFELQRLLKQNAAGIVNLLVAHFNTTSLAIVCQGWGGSQLSK